MKFLLRYVPALVALLVFAVLSAAHAEPFATGQREFSLTLGYGENHRIPTSMKQRYRFGDAALRWGRFVSERDENAYEVSLSSEIIGEENTALMAVMARRHYFAIRHNTALGYDLAFGCVRFEDPVKGLATRANFTEQVGLVLEHKIRPDFAVSLQYRFSHCSNGGIKKPNVGVNASTLSVGWNWLID